MGIAVRHLLPRGMAHSPRGGGKVPMPASVRPVEGHGAAGRLLTPRNEMT